MTLGAIAAYLLLIPIAGSLFLAGWVATAYYADGEIIEGHLISLGALAGAVVVMLLWYWGMAFTTSSDYHRWNSKQGNIEQISKRLISTNNGGMSERYVVVLRGTPYGVDDTRASLLKLGEPVSLKCKKDYQWGVDRSAHGWICKYAGNNIF